MADYNGRATWQEWKQIGIFYQIEGIVDLLGDLEISSQCGSRCWNHWAVKDKYREKWRVHLRISRTLKVCHAMTMIKASNSWKSPCWPCVNPVMNDWFVHLSFTMRTCRLLGSGSYTLLHRIGIHNTNTSFLRIQAGHNTNIFRIQVKTIFRYI